MSLYLAVLAAGIAVDAWLLAYALLRIRRTLAKLTLVALLLSFVVMSATFLGREYAGLGAEWAPVALWTFVLSHPLAALFILVAVHGEALLRRYPAVLLILAPAPVLAAFAPPAGYDLARAYGTAPLNWYLVLCLALPLGEAVAAWSRSVARRSELFLLLAGALVLVLTGPVYGFELEATGLAEAAGSNPGTPLTAILFAAALTLANPAPMRRVPRGAAWDPHFPQGRLLLVDEARPKASAHYFAAAVAGGRPGLKLVRGSAAPVAGHGSLAVAALAPVRWPGSVVLATASEFLARHPAGIVFLRDLAYLVTLAGLPAARDALQAMRRAAAGTAGTVVASLALLTPEERRDLLAIPGAASVRLPDPAAEIRAILEARFGAGAAHLLQSFAAREHRRLEDLTYEDVPAVETFLGTAMAVLARAPGDEPMVLGWRKALDHASLDLDRFVRRTLPEAAAGPWASEVRRAGGEELVVRASDYWHGKELDEMLHFAANQMNRVRYGDRVRGAFVQVLGRTGEHLFEAEVRRLGKTPADLGPEDVRRLAASAEAIVRSLEAAIDVASGRADLEARAHRLRAMLSGMTEEAGRAV